MASAWRRALVEQLGIEPEAETLALRRRILAGVWASVRIA